MPSKLRIIGLGAGDRQQWTLAAYEALSTAREIYISAPQASLPDLAATVHTLNSEPVSHLISLAQQSEIIYATAGHPRADDPLVPRLLAQAEAQAIPVEIIGGVSLREAARDALNLTAETPLQALAAWRLAGQHHPPLLPDQAAVVTHLTADNLSEVRRVLLNAYPDDLTVTLLAGEAQHETSLAALEPSRVVGTAMLYLPSVAGFASFPTFLETIAHLRAPDGCPWDREQTHQTLRVNLLEETYEVLEALDANDADALAEEMGDLLLQIVLHTQIAVDTGEFRMGQVIDHIQQKMVRRHPHVFDSVTVNGVGEVLTNWEAIKKAEKAAKGQADARPSAMDGVPPGLPALAQAMTISRKAVRQGFEWPNIEGVLDKLIEEAREIVEATDPAHIEAEIGDFLFSAVNLARWKQVDPESALRSMNARFVRRFKAMEALAERPLSELSLDEKEALWTQAKQQERHSSSLTG